ncbi:hypothetical protein ACNAN0_09185 [Agrilactobacillus fermenti]|uniref:hypothetical protein n=1 Tax=Agrilactobacillus fermenti TaxID=2586909 RepID=UPI001E4292CC|nr:hypothetical protein [Agrilactobacillus fermenti]MCD2255409.1 hypothetical protein [Agrilactobacillus fermenti]
MAADKVTVQRDKGGLMILKQGLSLYDVNGYATTNKIAQSGAYKVFAERYINGQQSLKLGTDLQWVAASMGAYYP